MPQSDCYQLDLTWKNCRMKWEYGLNQKHLSMLWFVGLNQTLASTIKSILNS